MSGNDRGCSEGQSNCIKSDRGCVWKSASSFDAREGIQVNGHFFKLISFYDNEWGYTSQIFRLISHMYQVDHGVK